MHTAAEKRCWVYILRCGDGSLYTGWTNDLQARIQAHQAGRGAKYTGSHLPVTLVYQEPQVDRRAALRREAAIKRLTRAQKLALIKTNGGLNGTDSASPTGKAAFSAPPLAGRRTGEHD